MVALLCAAHQRGDDEQSWESAHGSPLIHDRGGPTVFNRAEVDEVKHFVYVDNLGVLSANRKAVESGLAELSESFKQKNLLLHPGEIQHERIKALGVELDGKRLVSRLSSDRLHRVRQGLRHVLRRKRCSGRVLEILAGLCTYYCGLMNRTATSSSDLTTMFQLLCGAVLQVSSGLSVG